ncbi:MAG: BlaI/MecI/CopY family transcriptional regulator [Gemmatimonadota bacterium]
MARSADLGRLSRRERQIMEALYLHGEATADGVCEVLPDEPGLDSVRVTLRNLEKKGYVHVERSGTLNRYRPRVPRAQARRSALQDLVTTFFGGSSANAMLALLDLPSEGLTDEQLAELSRRIEATRKERHP